MATEKTEPGFSAALEEVEAILEKLERDEIPIDDLTGQVKRAAHLVALCRDRLQSTELEIKELVEGLQPGDGEGGA